MTGEALMTDLVYAHVICKRPLEEIAVHAGTTTAKLREELKRALAATPLLPSGK